jgi:hypothetical protein
MDLGPFFASGGAVDLALAALAVEGLLLWAWRRRTGAGLALPELAANLLAGACLLLALRAALTGAGWRVVAAWLAAAFVANLADLGQRLRRARR